jgi:hypothetical protein
MRDLRGVNVVGAKKKLVSKFQMPSSFDETLHESYVH